MDILIPTNKKNVVLDATVLTSLMTCPRFADLRFNHRFVQIGGKSNSLETGSIVHTFLEYYNKYRIEKMSSTQAAGFAFSAAELYIGGCKDCKNFVPIPCTEHLLHGIDKTCDICVKVPKCGHAPNEFPGVENTPKESTDKPSRIGWHFVLDTCQQYLDFYRNDHWIPLEVEVVKSKLLYEDDDIRILWKAKLDLVVDTNQGIYPVDHKTMKQNRDATSMNNQFMGQCLIQGSRSVFIDKIGFQKTLPPAEKFVRKPVNYTVDRLTEWQGETLPHYAYMLLSYAENGHFPPNFTSCEGKYGKCIFEKVCTSDRNMREHELKQNFMVGPEWNPVNTDGSDD